MKVRKKFWYNQKQKCIEERSKRYVLLRDGSFVLNKICFISHRDIFEYPRELRKINTSFQYVEIGAGLGEFMTYLTSGLRKDSPKPIVIDPANYELLLEMLEFS